VPVLLLVLAFLASGIAAFGQAAQPEAVSPSGELKIAFATLEKREPAAAGQLAYSVMFRGKPVFRWSNLSLEVQGQRLLGDTLRIASDKNGQGDETYTLVHGKSNPVRSRYNAVVIELEETGPPNRRLTVEARAFDDGVAFRYIVPDQPAIKELRLVNERSQFDFAKDATTYPLILAGYRTSYEDNYKIMPLSAMHAGWLAGLPFLAELPGVAWVALTEAHIEGYAGMYLSRTNQASVLESRLSPSADAPGLAVNRQTPLSSPWRVMMIAAEPGRLIESNMVVNLNPPAAIADTSWIKPGKTSWNWWSGSYAEGVSFKPGMNTETMKHYIDFSAKANLEYALIDAGWSADATGPNDSGGDITRTVPAINMPEILEHARSKNVRVWLWLHWTNVERQMDEAFPLYEKWGVAGLKIDFMDRDDQWMVDFYRRVVKKAAEHRLLVNFHGAYKPDGLRRTYPNLLTREGVLGLEYTKWSARVNPDHNVMLAFTRLLAGPMDYTPGGFNNVTREAFVPRGTQPMVMGTRAHQLALFVVYESPFMMVSDYPGAYEGQKELDFVRAVPVTWDETRVVAARVPDYVAIARRKGDEWYLGAITGWRPVDLNIPLDFLGGGQYTAEIYADAADATENPKNATRTQEKVAAGSTLKLKLVSGGGAAVRIRQAR
jgi:alpha-glucosidase